jgi:hypothetical protein
MGGVHSTISNSTYLLDNMKREIKKMIYDYEFWTKNTFCKDMQLLYHDKLIKFERSDLLDASVSLGIVKPSSDAEKKELCDKITNHYIQRIELLTKILKAIERNHLKVARAGGEGAVCRNVDAVITDFYSCQEHKGLWLSEEQYNNLITNFKKNGNYEKWFNNVNKLRENFFTHLKQLNDVIVKIKQDIDNSLDHIAFSKLEQFTDEVIRKMDSICDILYLLSVNTV